MARTARAAVGGVCYHVLNRGNDRKTIFRRADDFDEFLRKAALLFLSEAQPIRIEIPETNRPT